MQREARFPTWAWWIMGAVTILAISILIFSVVLGIRAGQQQIEIGRRQQVGIALQRATDLQAEGRLQAAFDEYQKVLMLDPSNAIAQQGIKNLLTLAASGVAIAATPGADLAAAPAATLPTTAPPPATTSPATVTAAGTGTPTAVTGTSASGAAGYWEKAQAAIKAGRWQEALVALDAAEQLDPNYRIAERDTQLFNIYVNLAAEKDNEDDLEQALQYYAKALKLQPSDLEVLRERNLISRYLDVLTYYEADWSRSIDLLEALYVEEPQYRDVENRLQEAHMAYGDQLADDEDWCGAAEEYEAALSVLNRTDLAQKRDAADMQCRAGGTLAGGATPGVTVRGTPTTSTAAAATNQSMAGGPEIGRILYSTVDTVGGRTQIMVQAVGKNTAPQQLMQNGTQPALRGDGTRLAFRNLSSNMIGISSIDPATGLALRFTEYAEDTVPSWNPQGSRLVFASNREGDRRWRIYLVWAEANGDTDTLGFGEAPAWSPIGDEIAFRGCDQSGNNCGIWLVSSSGSNRVPLTTVAEDTRPAWSPDGTFVVFTSGARDGNFEIYRVDTATGEVTRLTDSTAMDVLPTVSPDGNWVAFVSNRDGGWKLWAVPSDGGQARLIAPLNGDLGNWLDHGLQWVD
jgi:Tol biopolymer transport system component/tetratricopeptide (TPR) repeat protein